MNFKEVRVGDLLLIENIYNEIVVGYVCKIYFDNKWYSKKRIILSHDKGLRIDTYRIFESNILTIKKLKEEEMNEENNMV